MRRVTRVFTVSKGAGIKVHGEYDVTTSVGRVVCSKCGPQAPAEVAEATMTMRAVLHQTDSKIHN